MDATHDEGDCSSASDDGGEEIGPISASAPSDSTATKAASALLISASDKAGMQGIDRERINAILLRESGNSTFMQRQKKMDENTNRRIEDMRRRLEEKDSGGAAAEWRRALERDTIEPLLNQHRGRRRKLSTCVVVDLDGFFISCHILDNPHLATIPACVGGQSMISTSNYVARKYGVRAAMPGYLGSTLVKELSGGKESLTFVKHDFQLYKRKSAEVRAILEEYDGNLTMGSLDEAYMDIGPYLEVKLANEQLSHEDIRTALRDNNKESKGMPPLHETLSPAAIHEAARALLHSIRERVKAATGLTCSAGLCSNFLLAKIASDINKPNGQHFVGPSEEEILSFINPLPIRKVNGIGRVSEKTLRGACGVETVRDLYDKRAEAIFLFKPATAQFLMRAAIGYSDADKHRESAEDEDGDADEALHRKGISHERTFTPTSSWGDMCTRLEGIAHSLVGDLREKNLRPRTITLKVKQSNFDILSRATTRDVALFQNCNQRQSPRDLVDIVINLLKEAKREAGKASKDAFSVRLLGVRCSNFQMDEDNQTSLDCYRTGRALACKQNSPKRQNNASVGVKNPYLSPKSVSPRRGNDNPGQEESRNAESSKRTHENSPTDKDTAAAAEPPVECPICSKQFRSSEDNAHINAHIDACLNATTVKQMAKEETRCADERAKSKKRSLADFFGAEG